MRKLSIEISDDLNDRLWRYVTGCGGSPYGMFSKAVRQAIEEFLDRHAQSEAEPEPEGAGSRG